VQLGIAVLAPQIRAELGLTLGETGLVLAAFSIGTTSTLVLWGLLADRYGERATLSLGLAATAAAITAAAFAQGLAWLVLLLSAAGAFSGAAVAAGGRAIMQWFPMSERGLALGIRQASVPAGGLIAALALPALGHMGLRWAFSSLALLCGLCAAVGARFLRESGPRTTALAPRQAFKLPALWAISFSTALLVVGQVATLSFIVLFLHSARHFSISAAASVYAGTLVLGIGLRILAGHWSDRIGTRVLPIRRIALGVGATLMLVAVLTSMPAWVIIPALLTAGAVGHSWAGLPFVLAAERAGPGSSGVAIGLQQTAAGVGSIIGPIGFANLVAATSWRVGFLTASSFPLMAWLALKSLADNRSSKRLYDGPSRNDIERATTATGPTAEQVL
jgi:sugar phosphate permease